MTPKLRFNYKVWLETENGEGIFGYGQMRLLKALDESGTLKTASDETGLNYKKSMVKIKEIEQILGFRIIITCKENGHRISKLTKEGKMLVDSIEEFSKSYEKLIKRACEEASEKLSERLISCNL